MRRFQVHLKPSAVEDMDKLRRYDATMVADGMERHLAQNPKRESKSRIKRRGRLKGIQDPDYRLRLGDYRVFYNVEDTENRVAVLRVLHKDQTRKYYEEVRK